MHVGKFIAPQEVLIDQEQILADPRKIRSTSNDREDDEDCKISKLRACGCLFYTLLKNQTTYGSRELPSWWSEQLLAKLPQQARKLYLFDVGTLLGGEDSSGTFIISSIH
uniref:Uncharacterized protein n=1 Tax=Romanomermis culicivorax TaxID=13658 RepID=A0A915LCK4_ROMCU